MEIIKLFGETSILSDFGDILVCPKCGSENVHFDRPEYNEFEYESWEGRGNALRIPMYCESEHRWIVRLGHHKGTSFIQVKHLV